METIPLIFFLLFALDGLTHLYACLRNRQTLRRATKCLLMPLLALSYAFAAARPQTAVLCALGLGWVGDVLLIRPTVKPRQLAGITAFALGHFCYLHAMATAPGFLPPAGAWRLTVPVFLCLAAACYMNLLPVMPKEMKFPGGGYFVLLAGLCILGGFSLGSALPGGWEKLAGGLLFLASDTILCRQFFSVGDPAPKYDFTVMLTYLLAQSLLTAGFLA